MERLHPLRNDLSYHEKLALQDIKENIDPNDFSADFHMFRQAVDIHMQGRGCPSRDIRHKLLADVLSAGLRIKARSLLSTPYAARLAMATRGYPITRQSQVARAIVQTAWEPRYRPALHLAWGIRAVLSVGYYVPGPHSPKCAETIVEFLLEDGFNYQVKSYRDSLSPRLYRKCVHVPFEGDLGEPFEKMLKFLSWARAELPDIRNACCIRLSHDGTELTMDFSCTKAAGIIWPW